ncbi:MAG: MFS transporter [Dehalococcoidia bacterium]|nr:MFS transporter [Dehalococcoidia bacterium]
MAAPATGTGGAPTRSRVRQYFRVFEVPGFRLMWTSSLLMFTAFLVESLAQGWLIFHLTDSAAWVGAVAGAKGGGWFLFSLPAGTLVDRTNRHLLLIGVFLVSSIVMFALAFLVLTDAIVPWHLLVFGAANGMLFAVSQPGYNALTYDTVGPANLLNANAFRFMGVSIVFIGAALAGGVIIETLGVGWNYILAASAFLGAGLFIIPMRNPPQSQKAEDAEPLTKAMAAGLRHAVQNKPLRRLLFLSLMTEAFAFPYLWMFPVMAEDVLHVDASGLGVLFAMVGVGQLCAMIVLASLGDFKHKGWLLVSAVLGFGLSVVLFGLSSSFPLSMVLVALAGGTGILYDSTLMTSIMLTVSDQMRGRILGLYVATWGINQVTTLGLGGLARATSAQMGLVVFGGIAAANALRLLPVARHVAPHKEPEKSPVSVDLQDG